MTVRYFSSSIHPFSAHRLYRALMLIGDRGGESAYRLYRALMLKERGSVNLGRRVQPFCLPKCAGLDLKLAFILE